MLNEVSAFGFKGFGPAIEALQFLRVTDTLIVLDDFERKGSNLQDREVLGLVSLLIESKNCRVIMLLNEEGLSDEYFSYHEKVFDYEIKFTPTPEDAASIVFGSPNGVLEILAKNCIKLKINNIRLLKKISYYANLIIKPIEKADNRIANQAFHVLPLAILSIYGGKESKVDINFILNGSSQRPMPNGNEIDTEEEKRIEEEEKKSDYLRDYGFYQADEFDASIIEFIKKGYVETHTLETIIKAVEDKILHESQILKLRKAWDTFHRSFQDDEENVVRAFSEAITSGLHAFSIRELDSVASIFYDINRLDYINDIIDRYIAEFLPAQNLEEKDQVYEWPRNSYFDKKLSEYFESFDRELSFSDIVIEAYSSSNGMQKRNTLEKISSASDDDYMKYLSTLDDTEFSNIVRMLLKCGQVSTSEETTQSMYNLVFLKTYRALLALASRSSLNQSRMSKFDQYRKLYLSIDKKMKQETDQS